MQCTTSFLCDSCSQTTTAPAPRSTCFLLCTSRNAKMHACPVPAAGLLCPAMLLLLALLAAPPAVAAVNMSTYGALRVSVVRSAATGLSRSRATRATYPCRTLTGISRLWISSTRTAPSYIYALYMLMLEHVSSVVTDQAFCSGHHANDSRQSSQYCPVHRAPRKFPSADE